jgi:hypothetical protein
MSKLDLHGIKHEHVKVAVIHFIEDHWASGKTVEIVTGNSQTMKFLVIHVLDEYKLSYRIGNALGLNTSTIETTLE